MAIPDAMAQAGILHLTIATQLEDHAMTVQPFFTPRAPEHLLPWAFCFSRQENH